MRRLITLELRKLFKQKSFYICTLAMIAIVAVTMISSKIFFKMATGEDVILKYGIDFLLSTPSTAYFSTIAGIFIVIFVCDDFEQSTIKNIYSRGFSRERVYLSKVASSLFAASLMFAIVSLFGVILGTAFYGVGDNISNIKLYVTFVAQYIATMANMTLTIFFATILRKIGGSIATMIIAPTFVSLALALVDTALKLKSFSFVDYWLGAFATDTQSLDITATRLVVCVVGSLAYFVLLVFVGARISKYHEL